MDTAFWDGSKRLTEWIKDENKAIPKQDMINCGHQRCMNKLAHYEDLEENGRLIELPCKVGDTINAFRYSEEKGKYIISDTVTGVSFGKGKITVRTKSKFYPIKVSEDTTIEPISEFPYVLADFYIGDISEAEAKLKELQQVN